MINKKLDEIKASLGVVEELMQDNKYLESLDKGLEKEKHINIDLQNRINKAIKRINDWDEETSTCIEDYYFKEDLLEILKGSDKE